MAREFDYTMSTNKEYQDSFKYCSSKYSQFEYEPGVVPVRERLPFPEFAKESHNYMELSLEKDSHFYNISVNTNTSCVHVPTNIYYKGEVITSVFIILLINIILLGKDIHYDW